MRRDKTMLGAVALFVRLGKPVAAICHGPWMFCSSRDDQKNPVIKGKKCTSFYAIKDDLVNAGATWLDQDVVVDSNIITSRKPDDLVPFCHAIIAAIEAS